MQQRIAVVGSGMAGLAAAWVCRQAGHEVTVFEAHRARGMDAHTLDGLGPDKQGWVDVPLRVMSSQGWQTVLALCKQLGLETFSVDTFVSYSWLNQETWLRSGKIHIGPFRIPAPGSWRYLHRDAWIIMKDLIRLLRATSELQAGKYEEQESLEQFFQRAGYHPVFWRGFLLPILTTICTCREESLLNWPAKELLSLLKLVILDRQMLRLKGGTRSLVEGLAEGLSFLSGSAVVSAESSNAGVLIKNSRSEGGLFDAVICATQANQLGFLNQTAFARELAILRSFQFDSGELLVHTDQRFMPKRKQDWTALNYLSDENFQRSMFTVWVNAVEPSLANAAPIFQSWNPIFEPDPASILSRLRLQRAVVSRKNHEALLELDRLHQEPGRRVYFCGAWASPGVPLLESAVRSALRVAGYLNIKASWDPKQETKSISDIEYHHNVAASAN